MDEQKAQAFDALIYVHGFANSFADAVKRAAELSYDVGFPGVAFAYDWASRNSVPSYVVDQETAERSVPDFERFVRDVAVRTKARRIVIVAHSMGTRLVSYALRDLDQDPRLPIGPIIFAASDVDSAIFVDQFARSVARSGAPVTLYASSRDRVIRLSAGLVHADRRVGSGPPSLILFPRLDYVDASSVDTDLLGHGYFAENQALVNDLFLTIRHRFPAAMRNLHPVVVPAGTYYQPRGG
jgi:esterase/lipase superfamily enzyme